jgi:flavorubredoxin
MKTVVHPIAEGIYRLSTFVPEVAPPHGFTFNQFVIDAEEPLLFHCGTRALFPLIVAAFTSLMPIERLRWISFGHVEADECGAMNLWLDAAPQATVLYSALGSAVSVADLADRTPKVLADDETLDLGGKRVRLIATPHVPHGWEAQVLFEETTATLFCGDLFTRAGDPDPVTEEDIVGPALEAERMFRATSLGPFTAPTMRKLAELKPQTLALMHGSAYWGDGSEALNRLADRYEELIAAS